MFGIVTHQRLIEHSEEIANELRGSKEKRVWASWGGFSEPAFTLEEKVKKGLPRRKRCQN